MLRVLAFTHDVVWGIPAVTAILGIGIYLTIITALPQVRLMPKAIRQLFSRPPGEKNGEITPFQALCTALGGTVGTGNLVGVAGAICLGGPGSIFWMWICGFVGMATKLAEICLAIRYRVPDGKQYSGGPMYVITKGLGDRWRWLACVYCFLCLFATVGVGNATQINSVVSSFNSVLSCAGFRESLAGNLIMGLILSAAIGSVLLGGTRRVGRIAERLVPFSAVTYILLCTVLLFLRRSALHVALAAIIKGAFHPAAFTGGIIGSVFKCASTGCSRGVFTNEAGMGTASIAHASANVRHPVEQGMLGLLEVFLDTLVICTLTALVILCSGVPIRYGTDCGISLTVRAFSNVYGDWVSVCISFLLCSFAVATVLGWGVYGAKCSAFLFGPSGWQKFVWLEMAAILLGAVIDTEPIWMLAETVNGLMVIPNLFAVTALSPKLRRMLQTK